VAVFSSTTADRTCDVHRTLARGLTRRKYVPYVTYLALRVTMDVMNTAARPIRHFPSYTHARDHLRDVLDAARSGLVTSVTRGAEKFVVVRADEQRKMLARLRPADAQVLAEGGGWAVIFPGLPVHGDGETLEAAMNDALEALREYAEAWNDHLHAAANHKDNRDVVELVELSSDDELRSWVLAGAEPLAEAGA